MKEGGIKDPKHIHFWRNLSSFKIAAALKTNKTACRRGTEAVAVGQ